MIKTVLFDLDGTLLPMDLDEFIKYYFHFIKEKFDTLRGNGDEILNGVIAGTKAMMKNQGKASNEEAFWKTFVETVRIDKEEIESEFESFYRNEFTQLEKLCKRSDNMVEAVKCLREKGYRLLLTTNPMFPKIAVEERLRWSGINPDSFDLITSYEYCHATKPSIKYYEEVIQTMNLNIEECMMVGNDTEDDGVVEQLGIPLYLIEDHLINRNNESLKSKWHSSSQEFLKFVKALPKLK